LVPLMIAIARSLMLLRRRYLLIALETVSK
jgi:hypothetical protein